MDARRGTQTVSEAQTPVEMYGAPMAADIDSNLPPRNANSLIHDHFDSGWGGRLSLRSSLFFRTSRWVGVRGLSRKS